MFVDINHFFCIRKFLKLYLINMNFSIFSVILPYIEI